MAWAAPVRTHSASSAATTGIAAKATTHTSERVRAGERGHAVLGAKDVDGDHRDPDRDPDAQQRMGPPRVPPQGHHDRRDEDHETEDRRDDEQHEARTDVDRRTEVVGQLDEVDDVPDHEDHRRAPPGDEAGGCSERRDVAEAGEHAGDDRTGGEDEVRQGVDELDDRGAAGERDERRDRVDDPEDHEEEPQRRADDPIPRLTSGRRRGVGLRPGIDPLERRPR